MDMVKDGQPRAVAGSRSLPEVWFESSPLQVVVLTSADYSAACRDPSAVLLAQ